MFFTFNMQIQQTFEFTKILTRGRSSQ